MRLDYTLYVLAAALLIITIVPFIVTIDGVESETRRLWVITTVVLGLLSIGLGYSQRPKTEAQACEPAMEIAQATPEMQPLKMEIPKGVKAEMPMEKASVEETPTMELTQVKGIGEKRAKQLRALGINSANELATASAENIAMKLKISKKIVDKWIDNAKEIVK